MNRALVVALLFSSVASAARAQSRPVGGGASPLVMGQTFTIASRTLGEVRRINVYAPPVYADSPALRKTVYLANSSEPEIAEQTQRLAAVLRTGAFPGLVWHYEPMPAETHATIYHPAALRAFRLVLAPPPGK